MKALIDLDILCYEIGFTFEKRTVVAGETIVEPLDWELCKQGFDNKIAIIQGEVEATEPPLLFVEGTPGLLRMINKRNRYEDKPEIAYVPIFRRDVAVSKPYKGTRNASKPFHHKNLLAHAFATYDVQVVSNGLEADDAMCVYAKQATERGEEVIVCSRDKDLRQYEGWIYSWECGKQNSFGPHKVVGVGDLFNKNQGKFNPDTNKPLPLKVIGTGKKFFYYQLLTGDTVDNIVGVMGKGPAFAYNLLKDVNDERKLYELVAEVYVKTWGDEWEVKMREMIDLLWIIKDLDEEGNIVKWVKPPINEEVFM